jgi:hypothetical protein
MKYVHLVVAALLLLVASVPLRGQTTVPSSPIPLLRGEVILPSTGMDSLRIPRAALAATQCGANGYPMTAYRAERFLTVQEAEERATHERVHRRHFWPDASGTCEQKFARANATIEANALEESEAYCAQIHYDVKTFADADEAGFTDYIVRMLFEFYRRQVPESTLRADFAKFGCSSFTPEQLGTPPGNP